MSYEPTYLKIAHKKATERHNLKYIGTIFDQLNYAVSELMENPNHQKIVLFAAKKGYRIRDYGYTKSIDTIVCHKALKNGYDILMYVDENDSIYTMKPSVIVNYMNRTRDNNLKFDIRGHSSLDSVIRTLILEHKAIKRV